MKNLIACAALLSLLAATGVAGGAGDSEFKTLDAKTVKMLLNAGKEPFLLNPLCDLVYNEGHIPGSTNVPLGRIATTEALPADKNKMIICYCLGPT